MTDNIYAAIEIGSFITKLVVCKIKNDRQIPIGIVTTQTKGVYNNKIKSEKDLIETIKTLIYKMKSEYEISITSVGLVVPSNNMLLLNHENEMVFPSESTICGKHIKQLVSDAYDKISEINPEVSVVSIIPKNFIVNNSKETIFPLGMNANKLKLISTIYAVNKEILYPYINIFEKINISIMHLLPNIVASSYSALKREEVENGTCIVDIGADSTNITIFKDRNIVFLENLSFGSHYFTKIIEKQLKISYAEAENLKKILFSSNSFLGKETNKFALNVLKVNSMSETYLIETYELLQASLENFINAIKDSITTNDLDKLFDYYVFIGGGCEIYGIDKCSKEILNKECYTSRPTFEGVNHGMYTNVVGMIDYLTFLEAIFDDKYVMAKVAIDNLDFFDEYDYNDGNEVFLSDIELEKNNKN